MTWLPFDREAAAKYDAWYWETREGRRADRAERRLLEFLLRLFPAANLVEVGCGTGHFTEWLARRPGSVVGVDRTAEMLEVLSSKGLGTPVVQADAHDLPFHDRTFDVALMITALEFIEDPRCALTEAMRVANNGVVLLVLNRWSLGGLSRRTKTREFRHRSLALDYSLGEAQRLLRAVAGPRLRKVRWASTLFPGPFGHVLLPVPLCGDVIGIAAELSP